MSVSSISIAVGSEAAQAFVASTGEERRKLELLLDLRLRELVSGPQRSLSEIMDEIGRHAEAKGMTPELLASLLAEK